ncbi:glycosyltransferase [Porticoccaceae bacterium]|nr:glycosyltransferase [Porticoccaceae bacterium]
MRVLFVTNCYPTKKDPDYGIFVKTQYNSLSSMVDLDVHFINGRENGFKEYFKKPPRHIIDSCDVIHFHHVFCLLASLPWVMFARKKIVLSFLNEFANEIKFGLPNFFKVLICRFSILFCDRYIMKSTNDLTHKKAVYLPNGVDSEFFIAASSPSDTNKIFFVSSKNRFRKQKRLDVAEKVIDVLKENYGISAKLFIASGLRREEYHRQLSTSKLHLLCSDYEGSPNSIKEAMSCNIPVVSTDVGNVKKMFSSLKSPFYRVSNTNDPFLLAKHVSQVIKNDSICDDGRALIAANKLDLKDVAIELVSLYGQLIKEKK